MEFKSKSSKSKTVYILKSEKLIEIFRLLSLGD